jgi:hypothetical protein
MPRRKKPATLPLERFQIRDDDGESLEVEVWKEYPDQGKRGAYKRALLSEISDSCLQEAFEGLFRSNSPALIRRYQKLLRGERGALTQMARDVHQMCRRKGKTLSRSSRHKVALEVQRHLRTLYNAVQTKQSPSGLASIPLKKHL